MIFICPLYRYKLISCNSLLLLLSVVCCRIQKVFADILVVRLFSNKQLMWKRKRSCQIWNLLGVDGTCCVHPPGPAHGTHGPPLRWADARRCMAIGAGRVWQNHFTCCSCLILGVFAEPEDAIAADKALVSGRRLVAWALAFSSECLTNPMTSYMLDVKSTAAPGSPRIPVEPGFNLCQIGWMPRSMSLMLVWFGSTQQFSGTKPSFYASFQHFLMCQALL